MNLKEALDDRCVNLTALAEKLGISRQSLYQKLNGNTEFKASEIAVLVNLYRFTTSEQKRYFF